MSNKPLAPFTPIVIALFSFSHVAISEDFVATVPEPSILALFTVGAAAAALVYRNRRK